METVAVYAEHPIKTYGIKAQEGYVLLEIACPSQSLAACLASGFETKKAVETCRSGKGPVLICAKTYRHGGHHVNDPGLYMPKEKLEYYKSKDPVDVGKKYLVEKASYTKEQVEDIDRQVEEAMEEAIDFAKNSPEPSVEEFIKEVINN